MPRRNPPLSENARKYVQSMPIRWQKLITKALGGGSSYQMAIKAKCLDCSHFVVDEVTNCRVDTCPLWAYRPVYRKEKVIE